MGLFVLAWWSDRTKLVETRQVRAAIYALSLAVYCGSWVYFSSIGNAANYGWNFISGYVGASLAVTALFPVMWRIAGIVKRENVVSIADFLSSRYGKNRTVGTLVACFALLFTMPMIAMQLKGISVAWSEVMHTEGFSFAVLIFAAILTGFVILFGARRPILTEHNRGLVRVIALESVFKLAMLAVVALLSVFVITSLTKNSAWTDNLGALGQPIRFDGGLFNAITMSIATFFCSPRQFYVGFVQLEDPADLKPARWLFLAYIVAAFVMVLPIVIAGTAVFHGAGAEMYALKIPGQFGGQFLTALVFLGVFSSVAAMVMVETVALSAMISNEIVLPILARAKWRANRDMNVGRVIVNIRRLAICGLILLACVYFYSMRSDISLSSMTRISGSGFVQFLPALIGGLYWRRGHAVGAIAGLCGGFAIWLYAIAAPQFLNNFGVVYDLGFRLAAASGTDLFVQKVLLSVLVNTSLYVGLSFAVRPRLIDRIQASAFIDAHLHVDGARFETKLRGTVGDLKALVAQFLGRTAAREAFEELEKTTQGRLRESDKISYPLARAAERMLSGVVGAALARRVMGWQLSNENWQSKEVLGALDDAAQAVQFNRELLQTTLDHVSQGVYVVDRNGLMIAWNARYIELFDFPSGFVHVGQPISDAIRYSLRGLGHSEEELDARVAIRLTEIRHGIPHDSERSRSDGTVLKVLGSPMPDGRYVTSFTDVTELRRSASALQHANELLEERVKARTQELTVANSALAEAKVRAERSTTLQADFLAAASHDLLQPLQAARLFIGTVLAEHPTEKYGTSELLRHADLSIESADRLMRALLNLSRLEMGGVKPEVHSVDVGVLFKELQREFGRVAAEKDLALRFVHARAWAMSDPDLLRSVLQNLIGNAIRYTSKGSVFVGCRKDGDGLRFEVRDSGPGIQESDFGTIFKAYSRLPNGIAKGPGAGLGLSIAERVCKLLGHTLTVRSHLGEGSIFTVTVPRASATASFPVAATVADIPRGLRILYVENEAPVLLAMNALLDRYGAIVSSASSAEQALSLGGTWDVILADYHLGQDRTGLDVMEAMLNRAKVFALLTANPSEETMERAASLNIEVIRKPVSPAYLRTFLTRATQLKNTVAAE